MNIALLIGMPILAIILIFEGFRGRSKSNTVQELFLLDGKLKIGPFIGTIAATNFSLGNMIFLSFIWGAFYGLGGILWLWIGFILAAYVYSISIDKSINLRNYINDNSNSGTVHEFLFFRFSEDDNNWARKLRYVASLTTIIGLLLALCLEIYLASTLLSPIINSDITTIFIAITILISVYSAIGGFWSVIATDLIQGTLLIISFIAFGIVINELSLPLSEHSNIYSTNIIDIFKSPGISGILSIIGVTFGWFLVSMDTWQRASATRNARTAKYGLWWGTFLLVIGIFLFGLLGMYDLIALPSLLGENHSGGLNVITDFYQVVNSLSTIGQFSIGFIALAFTMAGLSTADTFLIVAGHSFVSDIIVGIGKKESFGDLSETESKLFANVGRITIIIMGFFVIILFFILDALSMLNNPLNMFFVAYSLQFALLAPVLIGLRKNVKTAFAAFCSLVIGLIVACIWGFGFAIAGLNGVTSIFGYTTDELVYLTPIPTILIGYLVINVFSKKCSNH